MITIQFRPGQFVLEGEPFAHVSPPGATIHLVPTIRSSITLGRHRLLSQDIEFGIAQIVEIAIRALSPAINDTFTGIACVDLLGEALTILTGVAKSDGRFYDSKRSLRLCIRPLLLPPLEPDCRPLLYESHRSPIVEYTLRNIDKPMGFRLRGIRQLASPIREEVPTVEDQQVGAKLRGEMESDAHDTGYRRW